MCRVCFVSETAEVELKNGRVYAPTSGARIIHTAAESPPVDNGEADESERMRRLLRRAPATRVFHSYTSQLNLSHF